MNHAPGTEQFEAPVKNYRRIPLWKTLDAGTRSPAETFRVLKNLSRQRFIPESLEDAEQRGRYTFLGYDPRLEISCAGGTGESFDWALLEGGKFLAALPVPCFLAGGISVYTIGAALALQPFGIDVSSGAEAGPRVCEYVRSMKNALAGT